MAELSSIAKDKNDDIATLSSQFQETVTGIEQRTVIINPLLTNSRELRERTVELLAPVEGLDFLLQSYLITDAAKNFSDNWYIKSFSEDYQEQLRVSMLADVINHASKWVYALSYADRYHMEHFWDEYRNPTLTDYLVAHQTALKGKSRRPNLQIKRIFVRSEQLPETDPDVCERVCAIVEDLLTKRGMSEIYMVTDTIARPRFPRGLPASFFIADDRFVSEGRPAKSSKMQPYAKFVNSNDKDLIRMKTHFEVLLQCASGGPVTLANIRNLRARIDARSRVDAGESNRGLDI